MKTTIDMAREAGFETMLRKGKILGFDRDGDYTEELKAFEALVRADEREACAKVCDDLHPDWKWRAAESIRARGNT
jgi:nicotinamidase-related amidase